MKAVQSSQQRTMHASGDTFMSADVNAYPIVLGQVVDAQKIKSLCDGQFGCAGFGHPARVTEKTMVIDGGTLEKSTYSINTVVFSNYAWTKVKTKDGTPALMVSVTPTVCHPDALIERNTGAYAAVAQLSPEYKGMSAASVAVNIICGPRGGQEKLRTFELLVIADGRLLAKEDLPPTLAKGVATERVIYDALSDVIPPKR
jgi:hypothetical protein